MTSSKSDEKKARDFLERLTNKLQEQVGDKFTFLLIGRTGVGKSSTINSLMGKEVAPVGDYEPTTMEIEFYDNEINGVNFTVIDTPGLCDDFEEKGNDYDYLEKMRSEIDEVDCMWFVSRLDETRVTRDEKDGIKLISEAFGEEIWQKAIIVFTFAGNVTPEKYRTALKERTRLIRQEITKYAGTAIAENIPSVAVDNTQPTTPDKKKWLNKLYTQVYVSMSTQSSLPFFMSTVHRIKRPEPSTETTYVPSPYYPATSSRIKRPEPSTEIVYVPSPVYYPVTSSRNPSSPNSEPVPNPGYSQTQWKDEIELEPEDRTAIDRKTRTLIETTAMGATVGATVGSLAGPVGAAVGGAIGAVIGFFGGLFSK
jgi:predicted GTPase